MGAGIWEGVYMLTSPPSIPAVPSMGHAKRGTVRFDIWMRHAMSENFVLHKITKFFILHKYISFTFTSARRKYTRKQN